MNNFKFEKIEKILMVLKEISRSSSEKLTDFRHIKCSYKNSEEIPSVTDDWEVFNEGQRWGGVKDGHEWFYKKIVLPENIRGKEVRLSIDTGTEKSWAVTNPQFIAYVDGKLAHGLDGNHPELFLNGKNEYDVYLYAYTGMVGGLIEFIPTLYVVDADAEKLFYNISVPLDICRYLETAEKEYIDIIRHLDNAVNLLDLRVPHSDEYYASVKRANEYLELEFYAKYCGDKNITTICIGHTHIDVAWLWTLAQTREKVIHSFSTVVQLMKRYPEYKFMSSQAQLYQYLKEDCAEVYEEVKELVRQGRWEAEGAMWVEADCNLSSGESLVRQILFGKRFFKEEFGVDCKILWLPDVFGYSAAMPQILLKSGVEKFVTSKISWNETNQMPNDTFMWKGIDGSEIFSYFLTAQDKRRGNKTKIRTTYNAEIKPSHVAGTWDRYSNKDLSNETLLTFGWGDGGGGPTREMLETGRRLEYGIPGCPTVKIDTVTNFLERLSENVKNNPALPKWHGELYLEFHRGTYTSIAKNKKNNRESEFLYKNAELLACVDSVLLGADYPSEKLRTGWELILLNQFHDIIPGSSIKEVYDDSAKQYEQIKAVGNQISDNAYADIVSGIKTDGGILVFNPHSFENSGIVDINGKKLYAENIPPFGWKVIEEYTATANATVGNDKKSIENKFFRLEFDDGYSISRIFDKENNREVLKAGERGNVIQAFEDLPRHSDAWEIMAYYKDKIWEINNVESVEAVTENAYAGLIVTRKFLQSTITQKIYLYGNSRRIDFHTKIDWKQEHILLKAAFPVDINADTATYDIQYGNVRRPTHANTDWDAAKFEVCAHKFADLSEGDYGVSLINNCKYGYDIIDGVMRLTFLKSATYPHISADQGEHIFTYSLYPHAGDLREGRVSQTAYDLNSPMTAISVGAQNGSLPEAYSFITVDKDNVIIEAVKKCEDSDDIIVRLYDCYNCRANTEISFGFDVKSVHLCDMMENNISLIDVKDNKIKLMVRPFEIVTLKITVATLFKV